MKKFLIYSFVILVCFAAGCKKDKQDKSVYLLKEQVIDDREEGYPLDTTAFTYDDQNRVIAIKSGVAPSRISFTFAYDNDGRIGTARKYGDNGALVIQFDFFYPAGGGIGYYFYGPTHIADTATFVYNNKNQVVTIQTLHSGRQEFTYDSRGNIASSEAFNKNGNNGLFDKISYGYDNRKNPFADTPPANYYFMYVAFVDPSTHINNVIIRNANTYNYTYNSAGLPTKAVVITGVGEYPIYFNYIMK